MTRLAAAVAAAVIAAVALTGCEEPIQWHRGVAVTPTALATCK